MTRTQRRSGTKALVCHDCVKAVAHKPGITPVNIGSFRGRPAAFLRHRKNGHGRKVRVNAT